MPKQVDYEERRRRIAEAVCLLIARSGMESVSLRDVAAEARVSMGAVQRCFRTKDEMLLFALEDISRRVGERAKARIEASDAPRAAATLLERTLSALALVDAEDRAEAQVWGAFVAHAAVSGQLAAVLRQTYAKLHDLLVWLLGYGQDTGELPATLDPPAEARALLALTEGLTAQVLVGHHTPESARDVLGRYMRGLLA
ncbi:TetR family transcriptional regulator C-terminal domain-containing protein [Streptomyces sp. G44]|uniref:TetR/AcrR family transcriptional regulator n=1 Tax=Streptomyces sp. G44 TaxID=2807632 RepID=UPI0019603480|nr:TetR family transcriptional regulator C-terminal domain-containing protein [Streptomyces sp. G44]MBM7167426.1 TetR family transcriptional regulator C-terminal domain-containing protein [Streptomyces sp. G44]